jgi:CBS-domain-containing membrane protein
MNITIKDVMSTDVLTLNPDDPVEKAVKLMIERSVRNLPVVDAQGRLLGIFSTYRLLELLLPVAVTVSHGLTDLAFVEDSYEDITERIRTLHGKRVREVMRTKDFHSVRPDTPFIEGVLLLHKYRTRLPVVDETGKLVGIAAYKGYLRKIFEIWTEAD